MPRGAHSGREAGAVLKFKAATGRSAAAGVEFIDENRGGAGVRLRTPTGKGPKKD